MRLIIFSLIVLNGICHAAPFADPKLPFQFSTVDARDFGERPAKNNLTVRGLCLKLDDGLAACYDTDLLRLSLVWKDGFLTEKGVAGMSYAANKKAGGGQKDLTKPLGKAILANDLVPGWLPADAEIEDTRTRSHDPKELGRGPMDPAIARYVNFTDAREYRSIGFELFGSHWTEIIQANQWGVERTFHGNNLSEAVKLVVGSFDEASVRIKQNTAMVTQPGKAPLHFANITHRRENPEHVLGTFKWEQDRYLTFHLPATKHKLKARLGMGFEAPYPHMKAYAERSKRSFPPGPRWPDSVKTEIHEIEHAHGYLIESIALPEDNPWNRRIRVSGVAADPAGGLYVVTFDGDLYHVDFELAHSAWKRLAAGLHEPQSVQVYRGSVNVFTRTGIIRVEQYQPGTTAYRCLSNLPAQTAETREFPMDMVLDPKTRGQNLSGFYLAKGGQNARGKLNGTIVYVGADGKNMERIATGLRQPYLGIHPKTGLLTASDQQGNYVPSTPVHVIRAGKFYGYREAGHGLENTRIREPACWIPHTVAASGAGMVWALDERFGNLNGRLLMLDFNKAQISQIYLDEDGERSSAAAHRLPFVFPAPLLKACMHPADGALYLGGFKVWGSTAPKWSGLYRMRYTGEQKNHWPQEVMAYREGILITFPHPLSNDAAQLENYRIKTWNYLRSSKYGSGYYKSDGTPGQEDRWASAARLSEDRRSVFLVIPKLQPSHQVELKYTLNSSDGERIEDQVYLTLNYRPELPATVRASFGLQEADLLKAAPAFVQTQEAVEVHANTGKKLYLQMGCIACHSIDGTTLGKTGPSWKGLLGAKRELRDGSSVTADEAYIKEAIYEPGKQKVKGFDAPDTGMPSYQGILNEAQVASLILYLKSLR